MAQVQTINPQVQNILGKVAEYGVDRQTMDRVTRVLTQPRVGRLDPMGEPEGYISDPNSFDQSYHGSTVIICKDIGEILHKRYPNWLWAIQPNEFGQVIDIFNLHLHTEFGFTIRMQDIMDDPRRKAAVRAGYEILRRFGMPDRFDPDRLQAMPRDSRGMGIPDIRDVGTSKQIRDAEIASKLASGEWQIVEANGKRYVRSSR